MSFSKLRDQLVALWAGLVPSQRATIGVVALALIIGFTALIMRPSVTGRVPISAGKAFTVQESIHAEQVLLAAGLDDFEMRGGQLLVPRGEAERYNAALIAGGGLPQNWAEEWESQMKDLGQFAGSRQRADVVEIARAKMVSSYLSQLPDIAQANVIWDEDKQPGFRAIGKTRATVFLTAKPGRAIEAKTIAAVRMAVANSKKHLAIEDVVVMDVAGQKAYDGSGSGDFGDETMMRIHQLTQMYEDRVARSLSYIPGVVVSANVNLEKLKNSLVRKQQINPKESLEVVGDSTTNTDVMQKVASAGEPGGGPNVQLDLATSRGPGQSREVKENRTQTVSTASFEITESSLVGGMAESVTVSVSIPKSYYRTVAMTEPAYRNAENPDEVDLDALSATVETRIVGQVEQKIAQILPPGPQNDPNFRSVVVDSITVPDKDELEVDIPFSVTAAEMMKTYGRTVALTGFALVALFMLNRSLSKPLPELPELTIPEPAPRSEDDDLDRDEDGDGIPDLFQPPANKKREVFQNVVRENPELAAAVISSWMSQKK